MAETSPQRHPLLFIVSGPAGSGKTTVCDRLLEARPDELARIVTATSREPRPGEKHGRDYYFFTPEQFEQKIARGEFYEHALVHGRHYGALKSEIDARLLGGCNILLNIDVQGAANYREAARQTPLLAQRMVTIFILPPDLEELRKRLAGRGSDEPAEIERRMQTALRELQEWPEYDYCIPSGSREDDFRAALAIYEAEKLRVRQ